MLLFVQNSNATKVRFVIHPAELDKMLYLLPTNPVTLHLCEKLMWQKREEKNTNFILHGLTLVEERPGIKH